MASYKITYKGNVIPTEITTLADGTDTVTTINSNVDKVLGGNTTIELGTTATDVRYREFDVSTSYTNLSTIFGGIATRGVYFLFVKIALEQGASTPDCIITLNNGTTGSNHIHLKGIGDFAVIPLNGVLVDTTEVALKCSGEATQSAVEIIAGLGTAIPARVAQ